MDRANISPPLHDPSLVLVVSLPAPPCLTLRAGFGRSQPLPADPSLITASLGQTMYYLPLVGSFQPPVALPVTSLAVQRLRRLRQYLLVGTDYSAFIIHRFCLLFLIIICQGCDSVTNQNMDKSTTPLGISSADASTSRDCGIPEPTIRSLLDNIPKNKLHGMNYPWPDLEGDLQKSGSPTFDLIGYGSLLDPNSARRTIKDTPENGHPPVLAIGATRVFDYVMPPSMIEEHPEKFDPQKKAALNLRHSPENRSLFNGRILTVRIQDIEGLRNREKGYDLQPIVYIPWGEWTAEPKNAYVLVARQQTIDGRQLVDDTAEPFPPYEKICRDGAALVSKQFLDFYQRTTYIGKHLVPLSEYLKRSPSSSNSK